jgi:hypothetical protein
MGLLDDAIREHLELKKRRGADPAEVAKQEREALGPIGAGAAAAPAVAEPETDLEPYDEAPGFEEEQPHTGAVRAPEPEPAYEPEPEPDYEPDADPDPLPPPPAAAAPPPAPPAPEPAAPPPVHQPTEQYSVDDLEDLRREEAAAPPEDVVPADEAPEAEDVLDETPEFLEETPEHDRLWFEQRPPRDFDF